MRLYHKTTTKMKQTITTLALLAAVSANAYAQNLQGEWTDGTIVFYAKTDNNGAEYTFDGFLGDDQSFYIKRTAQNQYVVSRENESMMGWSVGKKGCKVEYLTLTEQSGGKAEVIACYDAQKQLCYAVQKYSGEYGDYFKNTMQTMFASMLGTQYEAFVDEYGSPKILPLKSKADNKIYLLKTDANGITLYNSEFKDMAHQPTTVFKTIKYFDNGKGWWHQTSNKVLCVAYLELFDAQQLRLMRNEIYARHGWKFQSDDLQKHFSQFSWYKPFGNNSAVKLSALEQFNVNLIKAMETKAEKRNGQRFAPSTSLTFKDVAGIYDNDDDGDRISLLDDGTATWVMVGSLNYTEYVYTIQGNDIYLKESANDKGSRHVYDAQKHTLTDSDGKVYVKND